MQWFGGVGNTLELIVSQSNRDVVKMVQVSPESMGIDTPPHGDRSPGGKKKDQTAWGSIPHARDRFPDAHSSVFCKLFMNETPTKKKHKLRRDLAHYQLKNI